MYHDVHEAEPDPRLPRSATLYHVARASFETHLAAIRNAGLRVLGASAFLDPPGADAVALTFDDGWRGAFEIAVPLLVREGWKATFFVTRDFVGRPGFCDRTQLVAADRAGMEIGVHGTTHRMLSACGRDEIVREFRACKDHLEELLSRPVEIASLPGGDVNRTIVACAREAGLRLLCTSRPGVNRPRTSPFGLRRVAIKRTTTGADVARYCRFGLGREVITWAMRQAPRSVLGARNYSRLRRRVLGERQGAPTSCSSPEATERRAADPARRLRAGLREPGLHQLHDPRDRSQVLFVRLVRLDLDPEAILEKGHELERRQGIEDPPRDERRRVLPGQELLQDEGLHGLRDVFHALPLHHGRTPCDPDARQRAATARNRLASGFSPEQRSSYRRSATSRWAPAFGCLSQSATARVAGSCPS
jgi:peptidoglycan/xylan/chitin deacetylase (PgdA/CDA1 family)